MNCGARKGFTLIELLLVVVIIGILASIAIPKFSSFREKSYIATVTMDLKNLAAQQEIYHGTYHSYAPSMSAIEGFVGSEGVTLVVNQADGRGWAATGTHDALENRQCGIYYGSASASNAVPATTAGVILCQN